MTGRFLFCPDFGMVEADEARESLMSNTYLLVALGLGVLGAVVSYMHTRRYGTSRNVKLLYPTMVIAFLALSLVQRMLPWHFEGDWGMLVVFFWFAAIVGSLLTWRRINRRGNNWAQIVALRERKALMNE